MIEGSNQVPPAAMPSRRKMISGVTVATLAGLAIGSRVFAAARQQGMQEKPGTGENAKRTALHQEVELKATPQRLYEILLDSKQFAAFTGMGADIDPKAGGAFKTFGVMIEGRNIELVPNQRIVQAWRPAHWDPGDYSIVRFELKPMGSATRLVLNHYGFPEGDYDHLYEGWGLRYWDPLKKYLG
jgi:activator of HSP90 ATPase